MADSVDSSLMDEDSTDSSESSSTMKSPAKRMIARRTVMTRQSSCRRQGHRGRRNSHSQKNNLLHKLHLRQMFGKIQATSRSEEAKVFSRLPGRLAFFIRDAVPHSALTSGHVFLGFSRCGQFLLSYTQTNTENDQVGDTEIFFTLKGLNIFSSTSVSIITTAFTGGSLPPTPKLEKWQR